MCGMCGCELFGIEFVGVDVVVNIYCFILLIDV